MIGVLFKGIFQLFISLIDSNRCVPDDTHTEQGANRNCSLEQFGEGCFSLIAAPRSTESDRYGQEVISERLRNSLRYRKLRHVRDNDYRQINQNVVVRLRVVECVRRFY